MSLPSESSENFEKITIKKSTYSMIIIGAIIAIATAAFFAGFLAGNSSSESDSDNITKAELENLVAALEKNEANVQAQPTPAAQPTQPSAPSIIKISLDDDPVKGDPDAPITIVEFSDFQCPFCGRWYTNTLSEVVENYIDTGKANLVYRDMPLTSIHPNAFSAHVAAECADEQNKFWDYHNMLFEKQTEWSRLSSDDLSAKLTEYATTVGLNTPNFESCLSSEEIKDEVRADEQDARTYGVTGTPTFFIGNEKDGFVKLSGAQPFTSFQNAIDKQLDSWLKF